LLRIKEKKNERLFVAEIKIIKEFVGLLKYGLKKRENT